MAYLGPLLRVSQSSNPSFGQSWGLILDTIREGFTSKLTQVFGRIQQLVTVGPRASVSYKWPLKVVQTPRRPPKILVMWESSAESPPSSKWATDKETPTGQAVQSHITVTQSICINKYIPSPLPYSIALFPKAVMREECTLGQDRHIKGNYKRPFHITWFTSCLTFILFFKQLFCSNLLFERHFAFWKASNKLSVTFWKKRCKKVILRSIYAKNSLVIFTLAICVIFWDYLYSS